MLRDEFALPEMKKARTSPALIWWSDLYSPSFFFR
jgi:hypothetical protein